MKLQWTGLVHPAVNKKIIKYAPINAQHRLRRKHGCRFYCGLYSKNRLYTRIGLGLRKCNDIFCKACHRRGNIFRFMWYVKHLKLPCALFLAWHRFQSAYITEYSNLLKKMAAYFTLPPEFLLLLSIKSGIVRRQ